jgi:serine protease Do
MGRLRVCVPIGHSAASGLILFAAAFCFLSNANCARPSGSVTFAAEPPPHPQLHHPNETLALANLQDQFVAIADRVAPSVVAISASINPIDSDELVQCAELSPQTLNAALTRVTRTVGTGVVIDRDGYILTNEHVISDTEQIWITTDDRKVYPAIVVGSDPWADLAVLRIPAADLCAAAFAEPGSVRRGQWSIALGNPYGLASTGEMAMSVGVVSAMDRSLVRLSSKEDRNYTNLIQTTAEINPGSSGGPLFDLSGKVIGISTAVILPQKQTNGIGFAIPVSKRLLDEVQQLKEGREIVYGYIGVSVLSPTARQREEAGAPEGCGVSIDSIDSRSPASKCLKVGDIVTAVEGQEITGGDQFVDLISRCPAGRSLNLDVCRNGTRRSERVTPRARTMPSVAINRLNQRLRWRGLVLGPIPSDWDFGSAPRPESGLMVLAVNEGSPMAKQGISIGSVITKVAGKTVSAVSDLQSILHETPAEQCKVQLAGRSSQLAIIGKE